MSWTATTRSGNVEAVLQRFTRRLDAIVIALSMLVATNSLRLGFITDDYGFRHALGRRGALDLFRFAGGGDETHRLIAYGILPWWTAPDFRLRFARPLTGLLFALDDRVFGDHAIGYHLHSLAWFLALLLVARVFFRSVLGAGSSFDPKSTLALAVFAFRSAPVVPYAWVSARHVLVAAVPVTLGLVLMLRGRHRLAPLALVVGLLGSEAALAAVPFFVLHALWQKRWRSAALYTGLALAYLAAYHALGFGARGSAGYHDPIARPLTFLGVAAVRVPMLLAEALLGLPIPTNPPVVPLVVAGLIGIALMLWLAKRPWSGEPALRWLVPAAFLALLVGATGLPGGRVMVVPDLGWSVLVAVALSNAWSKSIVAKIVGAVLAIQFFVLSPLGALKAMRILRQTGRATERIAAHAPVGPHSFVIAASDPFVFLYPRALLGERVRCFTPLSSAAADHRVTRTGPSTLRIESLGRPIVDGVWGEAPEKAFATLFRDRPIVPEERIRSCGAAIHVVSPTSIEVDFGDREATLLKWNGDELERFEPPPFGESVVVPFRPGPSSL